MVMEPWPVALPHHHQQLLHSRSTRIHERAPRRQRTREPANYRWMGCCSSFQQRSSKPKVPDRSISSLWNNTADRQRQTKTMTDTVVKAIQDNEELKKVLRDAKQLPDSKLVVLEFTAPWSEPCKFMKPALEQIALHFKEQADFYALDVEQFKTFARNTRVEALPTFLLVRKTILERVVGVSKDELQRSIEKHLPTATDLTVHRVDRYDTDRLS